MKINLFKIAVRSLSFDLKGAVNQIVIIILLTAVITGSLLTGNSVRNSLRTTSLEKLGNTGMMVSSGIRYFNDSLAGRMKSETGLQCTGVLEIDGYCQNFSSGMISPAVKIFAVDDDFFKFQGHDSVIINPGEVAVNEKLSSYLGLKSGDEIIIKFSTLSDLPSDAPFAPDRNATESVVLRTGKVLRSDESGNFSLGISQITPMNIFISRSSLTQRIGHLPGINRLLFERKQGISSAEIYGSLRKAINPGDIGLTVRFIPATGSYEIISDRVFIDQSLTAQVDKLPLPSFHTITYLANSISTRTNSTPYSFISGLDPELYPDIPGDDGIIINRWLADDLKASQGDSVKVTWYSPDQKNHLTERDQKFVVTKIVDIKGIWADSLLMPRFPGIAGKESCSNWDAGVMINMDLIRDKDEKYWNEYKGTPKAFINYDIAEKLWGNNYGPVTAIRFASGISDKEIVSKLSGALDPYKSGFTITDLPDIISEAAGKSVDFSTLFISLGFFIILSAIILLILVISAFLESKRSQISTLFSVGFTNRRIGILLFMETGIIAFTGTLAGAFAGGFFNLIVIRALNSVWQGAVQTNTISAGFFPSTILMGFLICFILILVILKIKSGRFLNQLNRTGKGTRPKPSLRYFGAISVILIIITVILAVLSYLMPDNSTILSFASGISAFCAMILIIRHSYVRNAGSKDKEIITAKQISGKYYSFNPSQAVAPVLFLAAGLFAVIITGMNRMDITDAMLERSGGTGGFLLWGESPIPVSGDLNSTVARHDYGIDDSSFSDLFFVQAAKTSGNDASCLNLNHITSPPLIGTDPSLFAERGSFSFASVMKGHGDGSPWMTLDNPPNDSTIYGIADQTVLQYGLQIKTGDTLKIRAENGQILNVIISAGLKSSVFQGYVITGKNDLNRFFPSISGSQIFLADGNPAMTQDYIKTLNERLSEYGVHFEPASDRLASFFVVTNTYLTVFTILGGIGMILGVGGLGFILIRNFNQRRREFGLMMAAGFSMKSIRRMLFRDHSVILLAGILTGIISALLATRPSISNNAEMPWSLILTMAVLIVASGFTAIALSLRSIRKEELISRIRKE